MAADVALAGFSSILGAAKYVVKKIQQESSYMFKYQSYIDGFNNQVKELGYKREMVEQPVNYARQQGDEIYKGVEDWLKSVDDFTEKVVKPINEDEAKKRCFKGSCPNLFKRYSLSKKAEKAAKEGADLLARGNFPKVSHRNEARDLERKVEQLELLRERVEINVGRAERQGEQIFKDVKDWLIRVKDFSDNAVNASEEVDNLLARGNFTKVSYRNEARDLERKVKELEFSRQRVEKDVEHAERQGEQIFEAVKDWLIRVKDFSDKAVNASEEVDNLLREGNFTKVSYLPAPDTTKLKNVKDYEQFDSRMKVFQQVMEALKDNKFNIIGVYGMGGVGKTTLVKQVAKQVVEDKLFDEVVMAEVTQTPDHMAIQNKFAYDLGMKFDLNENVHDRAERLRKRLKKEKRVLIVLDNIWKKIELEEVGIPFENDEKERRCTIILTSRRPDLLSNQMNSRKNFSIEILSKNEAWQLFQKIVGDSAKQSDFQPTAVDIVERCGGLPVALSTVANALKNKELAIWKDALKQLRSSNRREIPEMDANVYSSIELSYNFLESNEAKSLFLLCGQFIEGHPINVRWLIRHGMGLGLFENVYTLEEGRNRVHRLIDTLKTSCLLLDGDVEDEVKMHDIIHVVAVLIAAEKHMFNITNAEKLKKEIEKIKQKGPTSISLSCKEDVYELPEQLECPQLKLLLFTEGNRSRPIIPDLFVEGMKELQVLHLDDIRCVPSLPSSLGCLINLKTLCLDKCKLEDIAIVGQLKNLEILSFRDSAIEKLPLEIGQLTGLQLLDLSDCWRLEVIASNVISRLSRLEELYMNRFTHWEKVEGGENASLVELKGLSKLTTLEILIPDAEIIPQDLVSVELERYKILIGDTPYWPDERKSSRLMRFGGLGIHKMKMLLKGIEGLYLTELEGFPNVVHELNGNEGFPLLKHLHIENCSEILHIISSVELLHCQVFPMLESLYLSDLINLEQVCQRQLIDNQSFSNLRVIKVMECVRLKQLFSFSMTKNLLHLQEVEVSNCDKLEMILGPNMEKPKTTLGIKEIIAEDDLHEKVIFPNLKKLKLESLPKLTSFVVGVKSNEFSMNISEENIHHLFHEKVGFPSLEVLMLKSMDKLRQIWPLQLASDSFLKLKKLNIYNCDGLTSIFPPMVNFTSLEELYVRKCGGLKYLFPYSMVNNLARLQRLVIRNCDSMEVVVGSDEGKLIEIVFPKLHYLEIIGCSNLRRFISTNSSEDNTQPFFDEKVALPNLMTLSVIECNGLRSLMTLSIAESMVNLSEMKIRNCKKLEEIIEEEQVEEEKDRMVFSKLQYLSLDDLPRLTCFCFGKLYTLEFSSLEEVDVTKCPNMKTFSQGELRTPKLHDGVGVHEKYYWEGNLNSTIQKMFKEMVGFNNINHLELSLFPSLREIWHGQELPVSVFDNLTYLVMDDCMDMSSAISIHLLQCLNNLKSLKISNCDSLIEVFHLEEPNADQYFWSIFPKLKKLKLINLPKLQRFCNFIGNIIELDALSYLGIENCPSMKAFISNSTSVPMIANKEPREMTSEENFLLLDIQPFFDENKVLLPCLLELKLSTLPKLLHLWRENSQPREVFESLTTLQISKCDKLEKIIQEVGEEVKKECIVFTELKYLGLDCLSSLTSFCLGNYTIEFPSLKRVMVKECPNMKTFSQGALDTPKLHKLQVKGKEEEEEEEDLYKGLWGVDDDDDDDDDDEEGRWEGDLNSTIQQLFKEVNTPS